MVNSTDWRGGQRGEDESSRTVAGAKGPEGMNQAGIRRYGRGGMKQETLQRKQEWMW